MSGNFCITLIALTALLSTALAAPAAKYRPSLGAKDAAEANTASDADAAADANAASDADADTTDASREAEELQKQSFIDLSKFRDADDADDEGVDDDIEQRGDDLDKESVSNFRDTIIVSNFIMYEYFLLDPLHGYSGERRGNLISN